MNKHLFKPDIVMPGGDLLERSSMMQVIGLGNERSPFYKYSSGSSFSAPLAANLAAKILNKYPMLNMQTIKALLINAADSPNSGYLDELIVNLKSEASDVPLGELTSAEKKRLSTIYSKERLHHYLTGYGVPNLDKCLFSDEKRVVLVLEDSVAFDSHKVINLNIPSYLYNHPKRTALVLTATLCYKFNPVLTNPMSYNPVHISFNVGRSIHLNEPSQNAATYAECHANVDNDIMAIKSKISPWSDDFYPASSKMFSNVQKFFMNLSADELQRIDGQISIIIRCTGRDDAAFSEKVRHEHEFSLVLALEEKPSEVLYNEDLYAQMELVNILEIIGVAEQTVEMENTHA
jgi:hypothetical protein